jgi:hypothetical protein
MEFLQGVVEIFGETFWESMHDRLWKWIQGSRK